jgi:hypothetical protein
MNAVEHNSNLSLRLDALIIEASDLLYQAIQHGVMVSGSRTKDKEKIAQYFGVGLHYVRNVSVVPHLLGSWRQSPISTALKIVEKVESNGKV